MGENVQKGLPGRIYKFSDTFGPHTENTFDRQDPDAIMCTDFRGTPTERCNRNFDIYSQPEITSHILRLVFHLHDELATAAGLPKYEREIAEKLGTGIFINCAPRTKKGENAEPFYLATARGGRIRIVTTPLSALAPIRKEIETLSFLPNPSHPDKHNGLYDGSQQFRSALTPILLYPNHTLRLQKVAPTIIPSAGRDWHIAYIDRFGNIVTHCEDPDNQMKEIIQCSTAVRGDASKIIPIILGPNGKRISMEVTSSLAEATPGKLSIYQNGGIDIVRKWKPDETPQQRLDRSAYEKMKRPTIGTIISLVR